MYQRRLACSILPSLAKQETSCLRLATKFLWRHTFCIQLKRQSQDRTSNCQNYTRGRWLIDDALQQEARYLSFNYVELCTVVLSNSPGAKSITAVESKDGDNVRVLNFSLDNGRKVVAKLPTSVAGPRRLTTNSEAANMEYSKS
jgi:hypothetical protein